MGEIKRVYGWRPDIPDHRDHLFAAVRKKAVKLPPLVDLRAYASRVEDQGRIGSCVAQSIVSCLEYLEIKSTQTWVDLSRLFLYYEARAMINSEKFDGGAYIRDGIKVLAKIGVPHESLWQYVPDRWSVKPSQTAYSKAAEHKIVEYQRLNTLDEMRECLANGFPFVFGFSVYDSFESKEVARTGIVPMPDTSGKLKGGHAVAAFGYDDKRKMFIVRNSWGLGWGDHGYCYMPYALLANRSLSDDFWTIRR